MVLALPEIQRGLHVALSAVVWVIISFLLVITLLATQVGRLGDMFGRVRMYEMGFAVFVLGSLACALAWNEPSIIAFRVLQGIGGAFIMANGARDRRPVPARAAGQGLRVHLGRLDHGRHHRHRARRRDRHLRLLAVDLLDQRAGRGGRAGRGHPGAARPGRTVPAAASTCPA